MQVTIDSTEPLDGVLAVLSTMFDTRIVTDPTTSPAEPATPATPAKAPSAAGKAKRTRTSKTAPAPTVDSAAVRAWARDNGTTVSARGALPKSVVTAYQDAHA